MAPIDPNALRVFITGFGPFAEYQVNPSWLSVKPLHDSVLPVDLAVNARPIHITTHLLPTSYSSILASMPGFHAAPPFVPPVEDHTFVTPTPPADGYDFILHVGVTHRGPLRVESVGHKTGYNKPDVMQALAPVVHGTIGDVRGFDAEYEVFPEELCTDINVEGLVAFLRAEGIQHASASTDAGHYCCEFTYYSSLAQSTLAQEKYGRAKRTPVLLLHMSPVDEPMSTPEVTHTIVKIVQWVCGQL